MKVIILVIILLIIIFLGAIGGYQLISRETANLIEHFDQLEKDIETNNWQQAKFTGQQIVEQWEQANKIFSLMIDHGQLHDLSISISRIDILIQLEEKQKIIPELFIARDLIKNIKEEEKPLLHNIF